MRGSPASVAKPGRAGQHYWADMGRVRAFDEKYRTRRRFRERLATWEGIIEEHSRADAYAVDAGCGSGMLTTRLVDRNRKVFAIDSSRAMIEFCRQRDLPQPQVTFLEASIDDLPGILPEPAHLVISSSVLEYVDDLGGSLARLAACLESSGVLAVSLPNRQSLYRRVEHLVAPMTGCDYFQYVRHICDRRAVEHHLLALGLEILDHHYFETTPGLQPLRWFGQEQYSDEMFVTLARKASAA